MDLSDLKDHKGEPIFSDPDIIGQSEYRIIHDLCSDIAENVEHDTAHIADENMDKETLLAENVMSSLSEVAMVAAGLRRQVRLHLQRKAEAKPK
jgi:predicted KAP-like P-loop ATPase